MLKKIDEYIYTKWNKKSVKTLAGKFTAEDLEAMRNYLWDFHYIETTEDETPEETVKKYITRKAMSALENGEIENIQNYIEVWAYALKK